MVVDSLKVIDLKRPIGEADIAKALSKLRKGPKAEIAMVGSGNQAIGSRTGPAVARGI